MLIQTCPAITDQVGGASSCFTPPQQVSDVTPLEVTPGITVMAQCVCPRQTGLEAAAAADGRVTAHCLFLLEAARPVEPVSVKDAG